jgi:hypothetical protein
MKKLTMTILHNVEVLPLNGKASAKHAEFLRSVLRVNTLTRSTQTYAYVVDVTPESAEALLGLNFDNNRPFRKQNAELFQRAIEFGFFVEGSPIRLAHSDGRYVLTDGQHRLEAIASSGHAVTLTVIVTEDDPRADYSKVDGLGRKRTLTELVRALGVDDSLQLPMSTNTVFHAALRVINGNFSVTKGGDMFPTQLAEMDVQYQDELRFLLSFLGANAGMGKGMTTRGVFKSSVFAVALVTAKYVNRDTVKEFWDQVVRDDGLRANDPRKRLHNYLREPSGGGQKAHSINSIVTATCWNAYVDGKALTRIHTDKKMPSIALTPYPKTK